MSKEPYFNITSFAEKMKEVKDSKGILYVWKKASKDIGVSEHQLKSIVAGRVPHFLVIIKICNWMGENIYDYIEYTNDKTFNPINSK